jgi:hypothetical protein
MARTRLIIGVIGFILICSVTAASGMQISELTASDGEVGDYFGSSASISSDGNTIVVGVPNKRVGGISGPGAAYIFVRSGDVWSQQAELSPSDGAIGDEFGYSVSISSDGNTVAVGRFRGAVYIFVRSGTVWSQQQKLTDSDNRGLGDALSISLDGNTIVVGGSISLEGHIYTSFATHIFVQSGGVWSWEATLMPSDGDYCSWGANCSDFGTSVSISSDGNTAIVGAPGYSFSWNLVYVFVRSGGAWSQQAEFTNSGGGYFGRSVSISSDGNTALIAAPMTQVGSNSGQGAAYIFVRSGAVWSQEQELTASDGEAGDEFGDSVSISPDGNAALVGAPAIGGIVAGQGAAYIFVRSGGAWSQQSKLSPSDGAIGDEFGNSVSISSDGNTFVAGAPYKTVGTNTVQGAAYVYVNANTLDHIVIVPLSATINQGGSQTYTATAYDSYNNSLGDVTSSTTFNISPDGSCTGATCTAMVPGLHTVTGNYSGRTAMANLQVNAVPDLSGNWMSFEKLFHCTAVGCPRDGCGGKFHVTNSGNAAAAYFTVTYYLSEDGITPSTLLSSDKVSKLDVGKSKDLSFKYSSKTFLGGKYIITVIDSGNTVTESNENNNTVVIKIP